MDPVAPPPAAPLDDPPPAEPEDRPAKIRMRIKGEQDGPVFEGQVIIVPCLNCGRK